MNAMIVVYITSISMNTPAGEAALLVQIHPISTFLIGYFWLKEVINRDKIISLILAMIGIIVLLRPWELESFGAHFIGDLLAISNGIFYSVYIVVGRATKDIRNGVHSLISTLWVMVWAFIIGLVVLWIFTLLPLSSNITNFDLDIFLNPENLVYGIVLGLAGSILPYGLLMIGGKYVESTKSAILLLGEPFGAVIFGFLILNEPITLNYVVGGILLMISIVWITNHNKKNKYNGTSQDQ